MMWSTPLLEIFSVFLSTVFVGCFVFCYFAFAHFPWVWLLTPLCIRPVYPQGPLFLLLIIYIYSCLSIKKKSKCDFLVLIPKKHTVEDFKDLRLISLVGGPYKILTKVLANRIKMVMDKVISKSQNDFVEGQEILDAVLIANEIVDSTLRRKKCGLVCKLDIEKAYDSISWEFLYQAMGKMGFGSRWLSWIKWCISTASFSVLINRSPAGFFPSSRGLGQSDPLSPYLFVIGMEALSCLINRVVEGNYLFGGRIADGRGEDLTISHILYADDTLLFCEADKDQLKFLSWILMWFEVMSGLKINLNKIKIM